MTENKFLPLYIAAMKCRGELRQTEPCLPDDSVDGAEPPTLKQRFLAAVMNGELGSLEEPGYIVTRRIFRTLPRSMPIRFYPRRRLSRGRRP